MTASEVLVIKGIFCLRLGLAAVVPVTRFRRVFRKNELG